MILQSGRTISTRWHVLPEQSSWRDLGNLGRILFCLTEKPDGSWTARPAPDS